MRLKASAPYTCCVVYYMLNIYFDGILIININVYFIVIVPYFHKESQRQTYMYTSQVEIVSDGNILATV